MFCFIKQISIPIIAEFNMYVSLFRVDVCVSSFLFPTPHPASPTLSSPPHSSPPVFMSIPHALLSALLPE